ncbi:hypothetical protein GJA_1806 [Janthinobacterium agaricidamnosum NBRC 102515 = DSM 9628]|uniref:Uncharacterized protein n=1 Tax=Janthinobacterium agaricidamnosum NBRC 102515 = DSM 9628 TaxID=1349767 RepID=W0V5B9_9BURK|nr:hypothetical protein GJA_1806 [Janthinobacterium agaricidamnosum NBRC 102515 = DSM 9628]
MLPFLYRGDASWASPGGYSERYFPVNIRQKSRRIFLFQTANTIPARS